MLFLRKFLQEENFETGENLGWSVAPLTPL